MLSIVKCADKDMKEHINWLYKYGEHRYKRIPLTKAPYMQEEVNKKRNCDKMLPIGVFEGKE